MRERTGKPLCRKLAADERGLTLIEVLTALTLLSMVVAILFAFLFMGISMYGRATSESRLRNQGDAVMGEVISELKDAVYVRNGGDPDSIVYVKPSASADGYVDPYTMRLMPLGGNSSDSPARYGIGIYAGVYDDSQPQAPLRQIALGEGFTLQPAPGRLSLAAAGDDRIRVHLVYAKLPASGGGSGRSEARTFEIDTLIPLFRAE